MRSYFRRVKEAWAQSSAPPIKDMVRDSIEQARESFGEMFDDRRGVLDPGAVDLNRPPAELEDPAERERVSTAERAARDAARAPYREEPASLAFTRFATTGNAQLTDVPAWLGALDPADVYGVYRVPDRLDPKRRGGEGKAAVEWEIAHRDDLRPSHVDVLTSAFPRDAHIADRRPGQPSVLDEDVAGELVRRARLAPEDCYGLTRLLQIRGVEFESGTSWHAEIEGVLLFTRDRPAVLEAQRAMAAEAPLARLDAPFHLEVLDWEAVAAYNSPYRWGGPRVPAPLPHLPGDWKELLLAYLEVVGVRPEDCYGIQATRTAEGGMADLSLASFRKNVSGGDRSRFHGAEHLVLAYRDRDTYVAGRERWAAYQEEVLLARLDHLSGARPPIVASSPRPSFLSELFDFVNPLDPMHMFPTTVGRLEKPSLGPYCGVE